MKSAGCFLLALIGVQAACSPGEPPAKPSWAEDVFPILQGSCNHCHGATVGRVPEPDGSGVQVRPITRLDVCDPTAPSLGEVGASPVIGGGKFLNDMAIKAYLRPAGKNKRALMPPPPALELTDYEYQVLVNWSKIGQPCDKRRNRKPQFRVVEAPQRSGTSIIAVVEVADPDGDQVLGKASLGNASAQIFGAGRWRLEFPNASLDDDLIVRISDGHLTN